MEHIPELQQLVQDQLSRHLEFRNNLPQQLVLNSSTTQSSLGGSFRKLDRNSPLRFQDPGYRVRQRNSLDTGNGVQESFIVAEPVYSVTPPRIPAGLSPWKPRIVSDVESHSSTKSKHARNRMSGATRSSSTGGEPHYLSSKQRSTEVEITHHHKPKNYGKIRKVGIRKVDSEYRTGSLSATLPHLGHATETDSFASSISSKSPLPLGRADRNAMPAQHSMAHIGRANSGELSEITEPAHHEEDMEAVAVSGRLLGSPLATGTESNASGRHDHIPSSSFLDYPSGRHDIRAIGDDNRAAAAVPLGGGSQVHVNALGGSEWSTRRSTAAGSSISLHSQSTLDAVSTLFEQTFRDREERKLELGKGEGENIYFTTKVETPRILSQDNAYNAHFGSKDLVNKLIEDVTELSYSTLGTKQSTLQSAFSTGTMSEWNSLFTSEKRNFDSAALFAEVRYLELMEKERGKGARPSKLKATVCADLLMKLCRATGRYSKVMEPILWELLNCVFMDFAQKEHVVQKHKHGALGGFYSLTTYFDRYREQTEIFDDVQSELELMQQGMKMKELVKKFQTVRLVFDSSTFFKRDACFLLWKGSLLRARQRKRVATKRALRYRWDRWVAYRKRFKQVEFDDYVSEIDKKIAKLIQLNDLIASHNAASAQQAPATRKLSIVFDADAAEGSANGSAAVEEDDAATAAEKLAARMHVKKVDGTVLHLSSASVPITSGDGDVGDVSLFQESELTHKRREDVISNRRSYIEKINRNLEATLSTLTVASTGHAHVIMPVDTNQKGSMGGNLDLAAGTGAALEAARIASLLLYPTREVMTQTPDDWMTGVNEQPPLEVSNSTSALMNREDSKMLDASPTFRRSQTPVGEVLKGVKVAERAKQAYKLDTAAACQMVAFVYKSKLHDAHVDPAEVDFTSAECRPLLEYTKELMRKRYGLKRLADKFFKGLLGAVLRESVLVRRLEMFGLMSGLDMIGHGEESQYTDIHRNFFFYLLNKLFDGDPEVMSDCFLCGEIDREVVLEVLPELFPQLEKNDHDLAQSIMFEVVDLPRSSPGSEFDYKVNIDEVLHLLMEYCEFEHNLDLDEIFLFDTPSSYLSKPSTAAATGVDGTKDGDGDNDAAAKRTAQTGAKEAGTLATEDGAVEGEGLDVGGTGSGKAQVLKKMQLEQLQEEEGEILEKNKTRRRSIVADAIKGDQDAGSRPHSVHFQEGSRGAGGRGSGGGDL